ncbi:MAG: methylated-DNA--[protein]-cysteine S-methyltransferase [Armatimonadota bacterium]
MKLCYSTVETPFGWLLAVGRDGKLIKIDLPRPTREAAQAGAPAGAVESSDGFGDLIERLRLYFNGEAVDFSDVPVEFDALGEFEEKVLLEAMKTPFGRIISYKDLAALAGSPRAARAVGNAMRKNPLPIVVPCHRVVHSDGSLGGYMGGLDLKRKLLDLEGITL